MLFLDAPNWNPEPKTSKWWLHQISIGFFTTLYFLVSVLLIDIAVFWLAGAWSFADWRWQIPNVLLGLFTGSFYIYFLIFKAKTRVLNLITFLTIAITIGSIVHLYAGQSNLMASMLSNAFGIALPILLLGSTLLLILVNTKNHGIQTAERQNKANRKSILIISVILWFLLLFQIEIFYDGNSILYIL